MPTSTQDSPVNTASSGQFKTVMNQGLIIKHTLTWFIYSSGSQTVGWGPLEGHGGIAGGTHYSYNEKTKGKKPFSQQIILKCPTQVQLITVLTLH